MTLSQSQFESLKQKLIQKQQQTQPRAERTFGEKTMGVIEKVADFTGGKEIAQGLGQALAQPEISKSIEETQKSQIELQDKLLARIKQKRALGLDTSRLEGALQDLGEDIGKTGAGAEELLNPNKLTTKQVLGDALQLGTTVIGAGKLPGVAKATTAATSFGKGVIQGAKSGAIAGGVFGTSSGVSQGLQKDLDASGIVKEGLIGAGAGIASGGILGGLIGGVSGGLKGRALRQEVLKAQIASGEKAEPQITKAIKVAKRQGIQDTDIGFTASMKEPDKKIAQEMVRLAKKAETDKRVLERPIDIVGNSMLQKIKYVEKINSTSGQAVDTTARSLKGRLVDATPLRTNALALLEDAGVTANKNGTPNWSKSIFGKTPDLQRKIMNALSDLPAGEIDAYDLHTFKKSIDEVVNYGVGGEGLKGKSASILKAIRNSADDILDSSFDEYNKANTDYKITREVLDKARELFGKRGGFSKERGGQILRAVFSNNASRPRVLKLIEQLDGVSNSYGGKFEDNLVDQALFAEILEDIYGTQATTGLQGQVQRAVRGAMKVAEGLRDPIKGAGHLLSAGVEKFAGISPEAKKQALDALLR